MTFTEWASIYEARLAGEPTLLLSIDIETNFKLKQQDEEELDESAVEGSGLDIVRIGFSYAPHSGCSVPWDARYLPTIKRLLALPGAKVVWNGYAFDIPILRAAGCEVNGTTYDAMWAWHVYQSDLPMGLEAVSAYFTSQLPWKHLGAAEPARYNAIDADVALQNFLGTKKALESCGQWDLYVKHVVELDPILYAAGRRGNLIDRVAQEKLKLELQTEKARLHTAVQLVVPRELKPRKLYKKQPKNLGGREFEETNIPGKVKRCSVCGAMGITKGAHFKGGKTNPCKAADAVVETVTSSVPAWNELLPFNANSTEQVKNYIRFYGHPMGTNKQDRSKDAADKKHLAKLVKKFGEKHPLYKLTLELHKVSKALGTYVIGFLPDADGLIHTTYTQGSSTGRLTSRNVNLQNVGKRDENHWAKAARKTIIARPGHVFVQADSSAIEAVFVGWFMASPDYIRLARLGVHDFVACYGLGYRISAAAFAAEHIAAVKAAVGEKVYKETRETAKRVVHLTNYGGTPKIMVEQAPETFKSEAEAARWQELLFEAVPGLKAWQHQVRVRAHKETYLANPWGQRHWFYLVFQPGKGGTMLGDDAKRCVAFLPQSAAACFMKDNIRLLGESWLRDYLPANLSVHDSLCVDVPEALAAAAADELERILTRPIPEMQNLRVGCEIEQGVNWGQMTSLRKIAA